MQACRFERPASESLARPQNSGALATTTPLQAGDTGTGCVFAICKELVGSTAKLPRTFWGRFKAGRRK